MACPAILTGTRFLGSTLAHIDCQGRTIGTYGYGALADPTSSVILALTGLLTVFVALFGIRLMLGHAMTRRDVIGDAIRVGLVLTLAMSWPAWRVVGYDLVMDGPAEVARTIGLASGLPGSEGGMIQRLQNADDGLVAITMYGTGRLTGGVVGGSDLGDSFHGIALADETGLGWGRILFLAGTIGPYAITRISAGLLLALAPLMAGLLFFGGGFGLFMGWLRGLAFAAFGALALFIVEGVELALLSPWIADVLAQRSAGTFTPSAPTELVVLALAFAVMSFGLLLVIAWVVFHPQAPGGRIVSRWANMDRQEQASGEAQNRMVNREQITEMHSRAAMVADAVALTMRREETGGAAALTSRDNGADMGRGTMDQLRREPGLPSSEMLGSGFRRTHRRVSATGQIRDRARGNSKA